MDGIIIAMGIMFTVAAKILFDVLEIKRENMPERIKVDRLPREQITDGELYYFDQNHGDLF